MNIFDLYQNLKERYSERNSDYQTLIDRYDAKFWSQEENDGLSDKEGIRLVINKLWISVNAYVKYLSLPFDIEVPPKDAKEKSKKHADMIEKLLYHIYDINEMPLLQQWLTWYLSALGTGVLVAKPDKDKIVSIEVVNPMSFYGVAKDSKFLDYYHVFIEKTVNGASLLKYDKNINIYEDYNIVEYWNEKEFKVLYDDGRELFSKEHNFGFVPVITIQNNVYPNRPHGQSDIEQAVGLNDYLNSLFSNNADIIDYYSNPKLVLRNTNLDPSQIESGPGGYITLEKDGDAHYLQWTGSAPDIERQIARVERAIEETTGIIAPLFGRVKGSVVTGKAVTNLLAGVEISIKAKQFLIGSRIAHFNEMILRLIEKYYKNKKLNIFGSKDGSAYNLSLKGSDIEGQYKNRVIWSLSNFDYASLVVVELQKLGAKLQSRYTTMQNLKIRSPYDEMQRIKQEIMDDLKMQSEVQTFVKDKLQNPMKKQMPGEIAKNQKQLEKGMAPQEEDITHIKKQFEEAMNEDEQKIQLDEILPVIANQDYSGRVWILGGLATDGYSHHDIDIGYQDPEDAKKIAELLKDYEGSLHFVHVEEPEGPSIEITKQIGKPIEGVMNG